MCCLLRTQLGNKGKGKGKGPQTSAAPEVLADGATPENAADTKEIGELRSIEADLNDKVSSPLHCFAMVITQPSHVCTDRGFDQNVGRCRGDRRNQRRHLRVLLVSQLHWLRFLCIWYADAGKRRKRRDQPNAGVLVSTVLVAARLC